VLFVVSDVEIPVMLKYRPLVNSLLTMYIEVTTGHCHWSKIHITTHQVLVSGPKNTVATLI